MSDSDLHISTFTQCKGALKGVIYIHAQSRALHIAEVPNRAVTASMKVTIGHVSSKNELHLGRSASSSGRGKGTWTAEDAKKYCIEQCP